MILKLKNKKIHKIILIWWIISKKKMLNKRYLSYIIFKAWYLKKSQKLILGYGIRRNE